MTDLELTELLATKIMGWPVSTTALECGERVIAKQGQWFAMGDRQPCAAGPDGSVWEPLENIADAWGVRAVLAQHGSFFVGNGEDDSELAEFRPYVHDGPFTFSRATATTAARAICECALNAARGAASEEQSAPDPDLMQALKDSLAAAAPRKPNYRKGK